jgi:hypothetical protein
MTYVLLGEPTRLWMTRGPVVWWMCSGWGSAAVVHRRPDRAKGVRCLPTAISTAIGVTGGMAVAEVFPSFGRRSALGALANPGGEFFDVIEDFASLGHFRKDLLLRVHHGGVVAPERLADLR